MKTLKKKGVAFLGGGVVAVGAATVLIAGVGFGVFTSGNSSHVVQASTQQNLLTAMHGEAFANGKYLAYSQVAGEPSLSSLFSRTADEELNQHFAEEADLAGTVGTDAQNLQDAINGESYETTTMYPNFASEARAAGDTAASALFTEIAGDEAQHRDAFQAALDSLNGDGTVPAGPTVQPVAVVAGQSSVSSQTLANLNTAMHGESFAYAKYMLYSEHASSAGHEAIATLFQRTAQVELQEHFTDEANAAGLAGDNAANLADAIAGENYEATTMYPNFASEAKAVGDQQAAARFSEIATDEAHHRDMFQSALSHLTS